VNAFQPHLLILSEGTKLVGTIAKDVVTTVVDKTAGETSQPAAFVRGGLDATGAVGSIMLDVADVGVRGAGQVGQVIFSFYQFLFYSTSFSLRIYLSQLVRLFLPPRYPLLEALPLMRLLLRALL
jgi:hypothetical protein